MVRTFGRLAFTTGGATLAGSVRDKANGERIPAKISVTTSGGNFVHPDGAILKVGTGDPFFYSDGRFEVKVTRGMVRVVVERGTEYVPAVLDLEAPARGVVTVDVELERWSELGDQGWHPGNTHIHYDEKEERPDERLWLDPRVEDLRMTAISVLRRWDFDYASNKYAPGMLTEFSTAHHYVQCGEENRHGARWDEEQGDMGYGHIMLLSIRNVVEPVSRGMLVDAFDPRLPAALLCLRRHATPGRHRNLVSQRPRPGGPGGGRDGQGRRVQPVRPVLDRRRVRHLLPDAERGHQAACLHRLRLVPVLGKPRLHPQLAARSTTSRGSRR